ncbi:ABC transporter ATP-binding protein [soil metagenome]
MSFATDKPAGAIVEDAPRIIRATEQVATASDRYPILHYLAEFKPARWKVFGAFLLAALKHSPVFVLPMYTAYILDHVIPSRDYRGLAFCCAGMAAMILMNVATHPLYIRIYGNVRRQVLMNLRSKLCERIQQIAFAYHDSAQSGRLHSKVMQDVEKVDQLGQILIEPLLNCVVTALFASIMISLNQPLFLIIVLVFLPAVIGQQLFMNRKLKQKYANLRLEQEKLNAEVSEMIVMLPLSRAHATEKEDLRRVEETLLNVNRWGMKTDWTSHVLGAQLWGTTQLVTISVIIVGAWLAMHGAMSTGQIVMFMSFVGMTVGNLAGIFGQFERFYIANEAMRSINEVLRDPPVEDNDGKPELPSLEGRVVFQNVNFTYEGTTRPVIRDLSVSVEPNQTVALVGGSGAGKTTFVKLLLGFYTPNEGAVLIDDFPMTEFNLRSFRRQIGIVTQETFLFNGTIHQNLTHGLGDNVPRDRVIAAAVRANAHDFITQLDKGYETEIGDRGLRLSGGQKQRVAIARALLREPKLLLLDEATSALDSQSENAVQEALEILMKGRTTFVIAHRLSTIRNADRILVFDKGRIVEDGHHDVLVKRGGVYAKLVALQSIA